MSMRESMRFAARGVLSNKLRSLLTMSGILIGVAAVIILIAAGNGASASIKSSISSLGSNTLTVTSNTASGGRRAGGAAAGRGGFGGGGFGGALGGAVPVRGAGAGAGGRRGRRCRCGGLRERRAPAARRWCRCGRAGASGWRHRRRGRRRGGGRLEHRGQRHRNPLARADPRRRAGPPRPRQRARRRRRRPVVNASSVTATYAGASHTVGTFNGTTPSYLTNDNDTVAVGVPFTQSDYDQRRRVALVGLTVATSLVGGDGTAIVGQGVQFNGITYDVVGLLTSKGSSGPQDQDDRVIAPLDRRAGHAHRLRQHLQHLGQGLERRHGRRGDVRGHARSSRNATTSARTTPTSRSSTRARSWPRSPRRRARSRYCSAPWPRSPCWWAASAS